VFEVVEWFQEGRGRGSQRGFRRFNWGSWFGGEKVSWGV